MKIDFVEAAAHVVLTGVGVFVVSKILPGLTVRKFSSAVVFALVVALLNLFFWYAVGVGGHSFGVLSTGLGGIILNGVAFLVAGRVVKDIEISGCFTAIIASLAVAFTNSLLHALLAQILHG
jgi:putative membrane protein